MQDNLGPQFQDSLHAEEGHPDHWEFDVFHSSHDELKQGKVDVRRTRVLISKKEFPHPLHAEQAAYLMGSARGEYPTRVMHRL